MQLSKKLEEIKHILRDLRISKQCWRSRQVFWNVTPSWLV